MNETITKEAPRVVSVLVASTSGLRQTNVKEPDILFCPETFQLPTPDGPKEFAFLNEYGKPDRMQIRGQAQFDLSNKTEKINYINLKLFYEAFKPFINKKLIFNDPFEQAEQDELRADRTMTITDALRENRKDAAWLTKVFRRVTNLATSGVTEVMAFTRLFELATTDPDKFFVKNKPVWEDEDFEMKSLVDQALERGALQRDGDLIKQPDGKIIAKNYDEAVFYISQDPALKGFILRSIQAPQPIPIPETAGLVLSEELLKLAAQTGRSVETTPINSDGSVAEQDPDKVMEEKVKELIKAELISKNGLSGFAAKYRLKEMEADQWVTMKELLGHFKLNPSEYERYKEML